MPFATSQISHHRDPVDLVQTIRNTDLRAHRNTRFPVVARDILMGMMGTIHGAVLIGCIVAGTLTATKERPRWRIRWTSSRKRVGTGTRGSGIEMSHIGSDSSSTGSSDMSVTNGAGANNWGMMTHGSRGRGLNHGRSIQPGRVV